MADFTVAFSGLNSLLQGLSANTVSTPYSIKITDWTSEDINGSYQSSGPLGDILKANSTKYVDLRSNDFSSVVDEYGVMYGTFYNCTSLVYGPTVPTQICDTFIGCSNLRSLRVYYDWEGPEERHDFGVGGGGDEDFPFDGCSALSYIFVNSETEKENVVYFCSIYRSSITWSNKVKVFDPSEIHTTTFANLNSTLISLVVNSPDVPHRIKITDLTANNCGAAYTSGTLGYILKQNSTKYVDLRETTLPNTLTSMHSTFQECNTLVYPPVIPSSVTDMELAFWSCRSLILPPEIPENVTNMSSTFSTCMSMIKAPAIPDSVTSMYGLFSNCSNLYDLSEFSIPINATNIGYLFNYCSKITDLSELEIPEGVTEVGNLCTACTRLINGPTIPSTAESLYSVFWKCSNLKNVTLEVLDYTNISVTLLFKECDSLETVWVPNNAAKASLKSKLGASDFPSTLDKDEVIQVIPREEPVKTIAYARDVTSGITKISANTTITPTASANMVIDTAGVVLTINDSNQAGVFLNITATANSSIVYKGINGTTTQYLINGYKAEMTWNNSYWLCSVSTVVEGIDSSGNTFSYGGGASIAAIPEQEITITTNGATLDPSEGSRFKLNINDANATCSLVSGGIDFQRIDILNKNSNAVTFSYPGVTGVENISITQNTRVAFTCNGSYWIPFQENTMPISINTTSTIRPVQDMNVAITDDVVVTIDSGKFIGQVISITAKDSCSIVYAVSGGTFTQNLVVDQAVNLIWRGSFWASSSGSLITGTDVNGNSISYLQDSLLETHPAPVQYSTTEQFTGNYWIDGKKIYRITMNFTTTAGSYSYSISALPIDTVVSISPIIKNSGNSIVSAPYYMTESDYYNWYINAQKTYLVFRSGANYTYGQVVVTIEYTKTTDD